MHVSFGAVVIVQYTGAKEQNAQMQNRSAVTGKYSA